MNCREIRSGFDARLDEQLPATERIAFDQHLAGCPACRGQWQAYAGAWATLGQHVAPEPSVGFAERTLRRLDKPLPATRPWYDLRIWRWLAVGGVAMMIAAGCTLGLVLWEVKRSSREEFYWQVHQADYLDDYDVVVWLDQLEGDGEL